MKVQKRFQWLWLCVAVAVTGCFHDDDKKSAPTATTIRGTAATGAALTGNVTAVGANGKTATVALTTNGAFTLSSTDLTFPALIKADNGAGTVLYSWAAAADGIANVTPLTTLALILTNLSDNLDTVFANWSGSPNALTAQAIQAAQAKVNANLQTYFGSAALDYTNYDFLTTAFTADGSGIDAVLDDLDFSFTYGGSSFAGVVSITIAGTSTTITFDTAIDTSAITIGGSGGGGGGGSGGGATLTCDTTKFQAGTVLHVPTATEWAAYAKTYVVDEGTFSSDPPPAPPFIKTGNGTLVLGSTYGAVTYNGTSYPPTTACIVVTDSMLYLGFATGGFMGTGAHIDIFESGTVSGFSPAGNDIGIKTP